MSDHFEIKHASVSDIPLVLSFIKELAEYEKLLHELETRIDLFFPRIGSNVSLNKLMFSY